MPDTASDLLLERLIDWGVDTIFGLPGDGINGVWKALRTHRDRIRHVNVRCSRCARNLMLIAAAATGVFFFAGVRTFTVVFIPGHYLVREAVATSRRPPRRRPAAPVGPRRERPLAAAGAGVRGGAARLQLVRGPSRPRTRGGIQLAFLLMLVPPALSGVVLLAGRRTYPRDSRGQQVDSPGLCDPRRG